jgi:hypothetical protein
VKPSDHPDYFRLPAPEGRSRESSIRLDAEGRFWHEGALVEHYGMARAFASWIGRHPDDGRYVLDNGFDWTYIQVEDAPLFVLGVHGDGLGGLALSLFDGTEEALDPSALWLGAGGALHTLIRGRALPARFSREAQIALGQWLEEAEGGSIVLRIGGQSYSVLANPPRAVAGS